MIREDSVQNFIAYVNRTCINRNATISPSIYETNSFLIKKQNEITLIEYAAFFGSIQILTFLRNERVELTPSLWINAIHGKNAELIHILEDNHVKQKVSVIKESIKCHHNEIADYFLTNSLQNEEKNSSEANIQSLKYYNFAFLQKELINKSTFCHLCYYDYYFLVEVLLTSRDIDINNKEIKNLLFQCNSQLYLSMEF